MLKICETDDNNDDDEDDEVGYDFFTHDHEITKKNCLTILLQNMMDMFYASSQYLDQKCIMSWVMDLINSKKTETSWKFKGVPTPLTSP